MVEVMGNPQYISGRSFEYARMKYYKSLNCQVIRAAASHGIFDLCVFHPNGTVSGVQCKIVDTLGKANAMIEKWKSHPPIQDKVTNKFYQILEVRVKGSNVIYTGTV